MSRACELKPVPHVSDWRESFGWKQAYRSFETLWPSTMKVPESTTALFQGRHPYPNQQNLELIKSHLQHTVNNETILHSPRPSPSPS